MSKEEVIRRETVGSLVAAYEQAEREIRQGCRLIAGAETSLSQAFGLGSERGIDFREEDHRSRLDYANPEEGLRYLRKKIWRILVDRLEVRRMMSLQKSKELSTWLDQESGKELVTVESVLGFFRYYVENLSEMLEEQVAEVYGLLRPRHNRFKCNSDFGVGPKVIVKYWVEPRYKGSKEVHVNYSYSDHFVALENVFHALDGRGSIAKNYRTELEAAIATAPEGETTYFRYRACLNQSLHLTFKRMDLVAEFNRIAGRRLLGKGSGDAAA